MKRIISVFLFSSITICIMAAQGIYFDIGIGGGKAKTSFDNVDFSDSIGSSVREVGVEVGLKVGYGPFESIPLYFVGEFSGIGHRLEDDFNYIQFNSYLLGPGIVYYPLKYLQIGGSIGISAVSNQTDLPITLYESESGVAGNVYAAFDLGKHNHGCLLGLKYSGSSNKLKVSGVKQETSLISFFIKYAYRHKGMK